MFIPLKIIWTAGIACCITMAAAQVQQFNSRTHALQQLKHATADSSVQKIYNYVGRAFLRDARADAISFDSAVFYLRKSIYRIDSANNKNNYLTNEALALLAEAYIRKDDHAAGRAIYSQVLASYGRTGDYKKAADTWYTKAFWLVQDETDLDEADTAYTMSRALYEKVRDTTWAIRAGLDLAYLHFRLGKTEIAEKELLSLISLSKQFRFFMMPVEYYYLSVIKRYSGHYEQGIRYALNAEKAMIANHDTSEAHNIYGELALEYQELDKPAESVAWYQKCLTRRMRTGISQYTVYRTMQLMVVQMLKIGEARKAIGLLDQLALDSPPIAPGVKGLLAQSLAYCYNALQQYNRAEEQFLRMDRFYNMQYINAEVRFIASADIGRFYVDQLQFSKAAPFLMNAFDLKAAATLSMVKDLHLLMFRVDSAASRLDSAIRHYQVYKQLSDSIFREANRKQVQELVLNYEVEKKNNDLLVFEKENKMQQARLGQAFTERNWIIAAAALLLLFTLLLVHNARIKQRANKLLRIQKKEISRQNESLGHLLKEKEWLVKEIHHRVKNNFQMVMGLLGTQTGYLKGEEATNALAESRHRVQAMSLIHQRLYQSDNLSAINIKPYIHELTDYLKESFTSGRSIRFRMEVDSLELDLARSISLGLILNEAITNAIKYAFTDDGSGEILIRFHNIRHNRWAMLVKDNGRGMPSSVDPAEPATMGLRLMKGLSEDLDADFSVISEGGTGILVEIDITGETPAGISISQANQTSSI